MSGPDESNKPGQKLAELEAAVARGEGPAELGPALVPPPLRTFGLVLHRDGSWSHEGVEIRNRRMVAKFDRSVRYLPEEGGVYVVQIGRFRGMIEIEEVGFFVREIDLEGGTIRLSDGSEEGLEIEGLSVSDFDGALLCRVKRDLASDGLLARFVHSAQAEFMNAIDEAGEAIALGGGLIPLPDTIG